MKFLLVCRLGMFISVTFGLASLLAPESIASLYGIAGWNTGTTVIARLFGTGLLYAAGAIYAVMDTAALDVQLRFARMFAAASAIATAISAQSVLSGSASAMMWTTVGIYGFFCVAWASAAPRGNSMSDRAS
jgi:hypothetical protein